jgi:regulator of replication initiation timing
MEENIFELIKRLKLGDKSILDLVKELGQLRADNAALRERLARLVETAEKFLEQAGNYIDRKIDKQAALEIARKFDEAIAAAKEV